MSSAWCKSDSMVWNFYSTVTVNAVCYKVMLGTFLWNELRFKSEICYGSNKMQLMITQHRFPGKFSGQCFQTDPLLVLETSPDLLLLILQDDATSSGATSNTSRQYWWSKTANYGVNSKDPFGNSKTCYTIFSIASAGVYWTTWWSSTQRLFQTAMINMNAHTFTNVNFFTWP